MRCIFRSSTGLKPRFLVSATGLSQNFADLIVAIDMYVRRFVGLMRMEVDAIWPDSQDRRHTLSISSFREMSKSQGKPDIILGCITSSEDVRGGECLTIAATIRFQCMAELQSYS